MHTGWCICSSRLSGARQAGMLAPRVMLRPSLSSSYRALLAGMLAEVLRRSLKERLLRCEASCCLCISLTPQQPIVGRERTGLSGHQCNAYLILENSETLICLTVRITCMQVLMRRELAGMLLSRSGACDGVCRD